MGLPFRAPRLRLLTEDRRVDAILRAAGIGAGVSGVDVGSADETGAGTGGSRGPADVPPLPRLAALARSGIELPEAPPRATADPDTRELDEPLPVETGDLLAALVGWAAPYRSLADLADAVDRHRARIAALRRDDAQLTLATAHSTKGLEFDHVAVIGMDAGRFPSARSLRESTEPQRALEEERRLAYVAWTRARRSLTLVYDPASPSSFLLEAFSERELGVERDPE
jgi:hypothetical protein